MPTNSLTNASDLLVRNLELFSTQNCLLVHGPGDCFPRELSQVNAQVTTLNHHYGHHLSYQKQAQVTESRFAALPDPQWQAFDAIILYWPKEKPLARMLLTQLLGCLTADGALYCVGANKEGIKSAASVFKQMGIQVNKLDSARHCSLLSALVPAEYATEKTSLQSYLSKVEVECGNQTLTLSALPGVFSSGRLDEGTKLLLENIPTDLGITILDFGCGCGVISTALALANPERQLTGVDVNACALAASEHTFKNNGTSARLMPVSGIQDLAGKKFDAIVTNPPFHQGVSTHYDVTEQLIAQAPSLLNRGGKLLLVANRHLNYPPLLEQAFGNIQQLAKTNKFVVYLCFKK